MKTPKKSKKELSSTIQQKIQEYLKELNANAASRLEHKTEKAARKLSKKFIAALRKTEKQQQKAEKKKAGTAVKLPKPAATGRKQPGRPLKQTV
jgi:hypothetical protein